MKLRMNGRRSGISPIVATVLIVAATLIAFAAVMGYVFGVFGSGSNTANVAVTGVGLKGADFTTGGAGVTFDCNIAVANSYITITNSGTAATTVSTVNIVWGGTTNSFTAKASPTDACIVTAAGSTGGANGAPTLFLTLTAEKIGATPVSGQTFTGTVSFTNGESATFTGTWS